MEAQLLVSMTLFCTKRNITHARWNKGRSANLSAESCGPELEIVIRPDLEALVELRARADARG